MKISKIYSSNYHVFDPIYFNDKLNIILAKITLPDSKNKTSHSLGKTTLTVLIDFCLLKNKNKRDFMWKRYDIFSEFEFYLEILLDNGKYCTIKRSVNPRQKVRIKIHNEKYQDFTSLYNLTEWDYVESIEKAKEYLNNILNFEVLKEYGYRKTLSYFLRSPLDFSEEFQLSKNKLSKAYEWKSPVLRLFGFLDDLFIEKYNVDKEIDELKKEKKKIDKLVSDETEQEKRLKLVIREKELEVEQREKDYDDFNFSSADIEKPKELVTNIDSKISELVKKNYYLESKTKFNKDAIRDYNVDFDDIKKFYDQIKIYFKENLVKDYQDVINFNKAVTEERNALLGELLLEYECEYKINCSEIEKMNKERQKVTRYIKENEMMEKFKILQNDIIDLKTDIAVQKEKLDSLNKENTVTKELKDKIIEKENLDLKMVSYLESNETFENEKEVFNKIIKEVLGDIGLLDIKLNTNKNPDFISEIIDKDSKNISAKDKGTSFKKLMCCAFDLSILTTYARNRYYHFVYHDGIFDGLDNRQKNNYLNLVGEICDTYNIQYIFTSIEDELPTIISGKEKIDLLRKEGIIVKELSDMGDEGRLFKMPAF
ncbi:DUF2326 domain-containing protein [Clostridium tagluense]|uniref:DUF2326 domain-containing protein n=1 Tax=Clostridium tagluense TaxID=360422 RepID=UPI001CF28E1F|nr:DUF2326 domain-containing protein [Clostridium tagluense]MCB2313460.1 DUF2326 domain-containing protein [Clostridium tagluense]MCB2318273.1 DUF2326 domain-containing protein [Clostridium tagluense]MCB2323075.1 DUF2326 domain-containing protein [Clostridium tagluense]MCB2328057.1 DUF2326 domain-containing protein [Clostridium tagluense]MCB2332787.1 DUF2326 domain-containing protein [Clostridium tagluense]